jgi:DNA-binding LytR/AlgR family response regulator
MLDIAICDDDSSQLALLATYTAEYMGEHNIEATIRQFLHPDALLQSMQQHRFSLYLLDILMPMFDGVEVGRIIRTRDQEAVILYVASKPGFALQSFAARPFDYLLKPVQKQHFFDTLTLALAKLTLAPARTCTVKTREGMRVLTLSDILYCEYSNHVVTYTLSGMSTVTTKVIRGTFTHHVANLLEDSRFVQPHVSYVVNMNHVEMFDRSSFTLRSGKSIPIAAGRYTTVRDCYMDYLASKG